MGVLSVSTDGTFSPGLLFVVAFPTMRPAGAVKWRLLNGAALLLRGQWRANKKKKSFAAVLICGARADWALGFGIDEFLFWPTLTTQRWGNIARRRFRQVATLGPKLSLQRWSTIQKNITLVQWNRLEVGLAILLMVEGMTGDAGSGRMGAPRNCWGKKGKRLRQETKKKNVGGAYCVFRCGPFFVLLDRRFLLCVHTLFIAFLYVRRVSSVSEWPSFFACYLPPRRPRFV